MKTKLVPANLKTAKEAFRRMLDGEVFHHDREIKYYYGDDGFERFNYKYRHMNSKGVCTIDVIDDETGFEKWSVEQPATWQDDLSIDNPVLCWVSDTGMENNNTAAALVTDQAEDGRYFTATGIIWKYATPILPSECYDHD